MAEVKLSLPEKVDKRLGSGITDITSSIKELSLTTSKVAQLYLIKAPCTLFKPVAAFLNGKAEVIQARSFVEAELMRREASQGKLAYNVLSNLKEKDEKGEEIPDKIEDTDNLFAIQNAASETTDEDFIKFWARLYTEEACKPNTISKKTVNLCKDLTKDIVKILEEDIFPYCDNNGFYFEDRDKNIESLIIAEEYNFIRESKQKLMPRYINKFMDAKIGQYRLYIFPGYEYLTVPEGKILTQSALEIRKCLKLQKDIDLDKIIPQIKESSKSWQISEKFKPYINYKNGEKRKFFITEKNKIVYPAELSGKEIADGYNEILDNIEYKEGAKQFFAPDKICITMYF